MQQQLYIYNNNNNRGKNNTIKAIEGIIRRRKREKGKGKNI
jgi:hypothetical protein